MARKSAREARKPQLYDPSVRKDQSESVSDNDEDQHHESEEGEDNFDFDEFLKNKKPNKRLAAGRDNSKPATAKAVVTTSARSKDTTDNEPNVGNNLFEKILNGNRFDNDVEEWMEYYKVDRVASINELVNLTLMAAGAKEDCIASDVDLDALDPEEIDQLLSDPIKKMTQETGSKLYPLVQKGKSKLGGFRNKYRQFWGTLTYKIKALKFDKSSAGATGKAAVRVEDMLRRIIEQLTMLSSISVVNIRDAVSEAVLCIADALADVCNQLKQQVQIAERQLNTEATKKGKDANPKLKAFTLQRDECAKELNMFASFLNSIFQSIFIHRSKDFNEDIRLNCLQHLPHFIGFDVVKPIKTEYLKYLGWACNDYSNHVRVAAIRVLHSLIQNDDYIAHLQNFADHFMDRFIEIAAGDVDADVSVTMIVTLRTMQRQGFLDTVAEDKLDMVDMLVFDPAASPKARKEALLFLMDHTEGFEAFDEKAVLASTASKGSANLAKAKKSSADLIALEKKKNTALQLETLTEFAEHHLQQNIEWCSLLAEACLETHKADLLLDWTTIIALLMRESEDLITTALQPNQVSILLRLFVVSASFVNKNAEKGGADAVEVSAAFGKGHKGNQTQVIRDQRESLNTLLQMKLPALLQRFKDDEANLAVISELFTCCDIVSSSKSLKSLLATLTELFVSYKNEKLIRNTLNMFKDWMQDSSSAAVTRSALESLMREYCTVVAKTSKDLQKLESQLGKQTQTNGKASKRKSSTSETQKLFEQTLAHVTPVLIKLKSMFEVMDCRHLLHSNEDDLVDEVLEAIELVPSVSSSLLADPVVSCAPVLTHGLGMIKALILWRYRDLMDYLAASRKAVDEDDTRAMEIVSSIISLRNKLVDTATSFLRSEDDANSDPTARQLQLHGFRTISWIRMVFPLKEAEYHIADQLAYNPSQEVLNNLRRVFEKEGKMIQHQMLSLRDEGKETSEADELSLLVDELVQKLLFPLSRSLMCDLQHLNRRQAAAVLLYWLDPHDKVQEAVRLVAKRLKDGDIVKYLEVQLVVLKGVFQEHVVAIARERALAIENEDEDFDFQQSENLEKAGYEKLTMIARKMSSLMGIAKLKDEALVGLTNFFRAGLEFAFSSVELVGFVDALDPYVRFLPANEMRQVFDLLSDCIESDDTVAQEVRQLQQTGEASSVEFQRLVDFMNRLEGKERNVRRLSTSTLVSTKAAQLTKSRTADRSTNKSQSYLSIQNEPRGVAKPKGKQVKNPKRKPEPKNMPTREALLETAPGRRSSRTAAAKQISYREEDFSEIEDFESDIEHLAKKPKGDTSASKKLASIAFGLDIEDDDDFGDDQEEVRDRLSALANDSFMKRSQRGSAHQHIGVGNKRARSGDSMPPFEIDSSPIGSDLQEMENIPSRKSRGR